MNNIDKQLIRIAGMSIVALSMFILILGNRSVWWSILFILVWLVGWFVYDLNTLIKVKK